MAENDLDVTQFTEDTRCITNYAPAAAEQLERLGVFGLSFIGVGTLLSALTICFAVSACWNVFNQKNSALYKTCSITILIVNPIASICSLIALAIPRAQLLSEAVTQVFLTVAFYRLYQLIAETGMTEVTKLPEMRLRVGPCCCWPCLPFPNLPLTEANLSRLGLLVFQLPIIQSGLYFVWLVVSIEDPELETQFITWLQPFGAGSILLAIYGLAVTVHTLREANPEAGLLQKWLVTQLAVVFTKLQAVIVRIITTAGAFPCNPPITPGIYANVTYNALILIEMLLLSYAARHVYYEERTPISETDRPDSTEPTNNNEAKQPTNRAITVSA